jgi:hypothetical protein
MIPFWILAGNDVQSNPARNLLNFSPSKVDGFIKSRHLGESRGPGNFDYLKHWIPAFARLPADRSFNPLGPAPEWEPFSEVGKADRIVELLKRLPLGSRSVDLKKRRPIGRRDMKIRWG